MKLATLLVAVAVFSAAPAAAQQNTAAQIAQIRAGYAAVQDGLEGFTRAEKPYYFGDGEGLVTAYSDSAGIRKLVVEFERDGYTGLSEYFFQNGMLFFAFIKEETFQIWPDQDPDEFGVTENRYYLSGERLVRWLVKSHTENMRQREVPPDHEGYSAEGGRLVDDARTWKDFSESAIADYEAFLDSRRR